jgi:hypothetical protein
VSVFLAITKYLRKSIKRRKDLFLAHDFRGFSSWSLGSIVSGPVGKQNDHSGRAQWI